MPHVQLCTGDSAITELTIKAWVMTSTLMAVGGGFQRASGVVIFVELCQSQVPEFVSVSLHRCALVHIETVRATLNNTPDAPDQRTNHVNSTPHRARVTHANIFSVWLKETQSHIVAAFVFLTTVILTGACHVAHLA